MSYRFIKILIELFESSITFTIGNDDTNYLRLAININSLIKISTKSLAKSLNYLKNWGTILVFVLYILIFDILQKTICKIIIKKIL